MQRCQKHSPSSQPSPPGEGETSAVYGRLWLFVSVFRRYSKWFLQGSLKFQVSSRNGRGSAASCRKSVRVPVIGEDARFRPLRTALFSFAWLTQLYMRNSLIVKRLEIKTRKNGPPASAYARVFTEELFFASGQSSAVSCWYAHRSWMSALARVGAPRSGGKSRAERVRKASRVRTRASRNRATARLCSPLLGIARLCSPFARKFFFAARRHRKAVRRTTPASARRNQGGAIDANRRPALQSMS
jgi:hypothetical protein